MGREVEQVHLKSQSRSAKETCVSATVNLYDLASMADMYILSSSPTQVFDQVSVDGTPF